MTDEVARAWPDLEAQARRDADRLGLLNPSIWYRTDTRTFGALPLVPGHPSSVIEQGEPTDPQGGTIISASTDPDGIAAEVRTELGPDPELTDEQIDDRARALKDERPDLDWDNILMGRLAGPATPHRPDIPVWNYSTYAQNHPEVLLSELTAIRFPVRLFESHWDVTSIDEELKPFPTSLKSAPPKPRFIIDAGSIVRRYAALHEAGVIRWDPAMRGIAYEQPPGEYRAVISAWARTLIPTE